MPPMIWQERLGAVRVCEPGDAPSARRFLFSLPHHWRETIGAEHDGSHLVVAGTRGMLRVYEAQKWIIKMAIEVGRDL
jgi:hypothetical protein